MEIMKPSIKAILENIESAQESLDEKTISMLFPEFTVDKTVINSEDQVKYLKVVSKL